MFTKDLISSFKTNMSHEKESRAQGRRSKIIFYLKIQNIH